MTSSAFCTTGHVPIESQYTQYVQLVPSTSTTGSYNLSLPATLPEENGQFLSSDTGGFCSWASAGTGSTGATGPTGPVNAGVSTSVTGGFTGSAVTPGVT